MTSHDHGNPRLCRAERRPSSFMSKGHLQGKGSKQCRQRGRIILRAQIKPATPRAGSAPSLNGKDPSTLEALAEPLEFEHYKIKPVFSGSSGSGYQDSVINLMVAFQYSAVPCCNPNDQAGKYRTGIM